MSSLQAEQAITEKMDCIEEILEELVLDAFISVLIKTADRIQTIAKNYRRYNCYRDECHHRDDMKF